jgi:hypothetical protein
MVIINTSAVEVSIHAVSPELMSENFARYGAVGAGAAAAAAAGAAAAGAAGAAAAGASVAAAGAACSWSAKAINGTLNTSANRQAASAPTPVRTPDLVSVCDFKAMRMV